MDTLRVLVTDDESEMRRAIDRALSKYTVHLPDVDQEIHFTVEQAASGEEALEKIEANPPDILLLDHKMGGISGLEVLDELTRREKNVLTIMITAYASLETAIIATKRGAFDFIAKPFTPTELKETVRKATTHLVAQQQARRLAQEKHQVRFQFISVLAHELKAPLNAIEGYLQILKEPSLRQDEASVNQMVERCLVRSGGMRKLIADLLDLTRIESGTKQRELTDVDLVSLARTAIDTVKPAAMEHNITVELHAPADSLNMNADRGELEIIFNNLLSNAVKYNRPNGRVDLTLGATENEIVITVADTGIGMTPEETAKLFKDFVRIKNDKTRNIMGSGLGLSIVKKLATLYGGDVSVTSQPDVGSKFTVRLNRVPDTVHH